MRVARDLKWKGMYPTATAHRAQNRGFISFRITQQVVQTFSNSKPWDKATIFFKALHPKEIWNCCYSKACEWWPGRFLLSCRAITSTILLVPVCQLKHIFGGNTNSHGYSQKTWIVNACSFTDFIQTLSWMKDFTPNSFFLHKQPSSRSQKSWPAEWGQECNRLATTSNSLVLTTASAINFSHPKSSYRKWPYTKPY